MLRFRERGKDSPFPHITFIIGKTLLKNIIS